MTVPNWSLDTLVHKAAELGCVGVELRNDLPAPMFDDLGPDAACELLEKQGLRLFALAEVPAFDSGEADVPETLSALAKLAERAGADGVALIPSVGRAQRSKAENQAALEAAISELAPILEKHGLVGFIEPIGFGNSSIRYKADVVAAIEKLHVVGRFKLIHDTFHHYLSQEDAYFAEHTGMVHVSGVNKDSSHRLEMVDGDRVLVDRNDRLNNIAQIKKLRSEGYTGPVSFEAFSADVHNFSDPKAELSRSIHFIESGLAAKAA